MDSKGYLYYYYNYKSSFVAGATSSVSFLGSYPTTFVNNYLFSSNEGKKDAQDIFCDWKIVGEDIKSGEDRFVVDYLNERKHKSSFPKS